MHPSKNRLVLLPQIHEHKQHMSPAIVKNKSPHQCKNPQDMLREITALLEGTLQEKHSKSIQCCLLIVDRCRTMLREDRENRNNIFGGSFGQSTAELKLQKKELEIVELRHRIKELTLSYNKRIATILKRKLVLDSQSLNYDDLMKIDTRGQNTGSIVLNPINRLESAKSSRMAATGEILQDQVETPTYLTETMKTDRVASANTDIRLEKQQLLSKLQQSDTKISELESQIATKDRLLKILKNELDDKDNEYLYELKIVQDRLKETDLKNTNSDIRWVKMIKVLQKELISQKKEFIYTEKSYMNRIGELERQLQK